MSIGKYFIMGLPEAGKTTYIAALWYILNNSNESSLRIDNYSGDLSYLTDIGKKWANIEKMPRTLKPSEKLSIELPLTNSRNEQIILTFPDLSGESFQEQYVNRVAKIEHAEFIKDCLGVFLFILS